MAGEADRFRFLRWDLSDVDRIQQYADQVIGEVGPIAGLVHCAGAQLTVPLGMSKPGIVAGLFAINTFAAMELVRCFSRRPAVDERGAAFVLVSSVAAHEGAVGKAAYAASKGALEGFLRAAAAELMPRRVRLNVIVPGIVDTEMTHEFVDRMDAVQRAALGTEYPLGIGQPRHVADLIAFLLSDRAEWISGQSFVIDGGHLSRGG
jgi:NAD(P)-dependent dehydrogenase (short-subunit alcohol dehydrogenase family)